MFDPRDDTRDRGEDGRERAYEGRDHTGDPRDVFLHDVDLPLDQTGNKSLVDQHSAGWNQIAGWLKAVDSVRNQ